MNEASNRSGLRDKLKTIIATSLRRPNLTKEQFDSLDLINSLGITSVDALEILIGIETEFNFLIPDEDLDRKLIERLDSLEDYVKMALARSEPGREA